MSRRQILERLQADKTFDLLIVGGGATGCGVALDAATRGLDVALVERDDFAQGTSSKSTKLVHGGVRYLEKAILKADKEQFALVHEGLRERGYLLRNAPHLAHPVQLMTPVDSWKDAAYLFAGLTMYDLLAGRLGLGHSRFVTRSKAQRLFPTLRLGKAKGAVLYYDGQFNDARMAVTLARTAALHGATCANHVEVIDLVRENGRLCGAVLQDVATGETWHVRARGIINATGPFSDGLRRMDDQNACDILKVSSGIHLVIDPGHTPPHLGLMVPRTDDGRVLFMIPWQGHVVFGTTDEPVDISRDPVPTQEDIDYLLNYAGRYLSRPLSRDDVRAAWCGLRPLVFEADKSCTQELARTHVIEVSPGGLLTITGGKWTSYRRMAEDTIDRADAAFELGLQRPCVTRDLRVIGSRGFVRGAHAEMARDFGVDPALARGLFELHGDETPLILTLAREEGLMDRLHPAHNYIGAQVAFAVRHEMAVHLTDVMVRRLPLGLVDVQHTLEASAPAADIMAQKLGWDAATRQREMEALAAYLAAWRPAPDAATT